MNAIASDMLTEQPMNEAVKPSLAQRIDEIILHAVVDVVQEAREEGWRAGYAAGRIDVRREMNVRLRALILDEDDSGFAPQPGDAQADEAVSLVDIFDQMSSGTRDTTAGVAGAAALARPPTEAGGIAPAKAAEEEAEGEAGAATAASSCDAAAPQQDTAALQPPSRPPAIHPSIAPPGPRPDGINPKAKVIDLPPPAPNGKIYTSFYNIRAWAGVYGITYDGTNIDKVNKLRTAKSMPSLVQEG